jgi:hypothetical protein
VGPIPGADPLQHLEPGVVSSGEEPDVDVLDSEDAVWSDAIRKVRFLLVELDRDVEREEPLDESRSLPPSTAQALGSAEQNPSIASAPESAMSR